MNTEILKSIEAIKAELANNIKSNEKILNDLDLLKEQILSGTNKFNVGDWVATNVENNNYYRISGIEESSNNMFRYYLFDDIHGNYNIHNVVEDVNSQFHKWSIKDIKSGDVIVDDDFICIVKSLNESNKTLTSYFFNTNGSWGVDTVHDLALFNNPHPATYEERRQLFDYINGTNEYEWNEFSKKLIHKQKTPNFAIGDWICDDNEVLLIVDIKNGKYIFENDLAGDISFTDEHYKLWDIDNAIEGDVLVNSNGNPFLFSGKFDMDFNNPIAYCGINNDNEFQLGKGNSWTNINVVKPANKEQCKRLFDAMDDAGYVLDKDNSQLIKVKSLEEIMSNFGELYNKLIKYCDEFKEKYDKK